MTKTDRAFMEYLEAEGIVREGFTEDGKAAYLVTPKGAAMTKEAIAALCWKYVYEGTDAVPLQ